VKFKERFANLKPSEPKVKPVETGLKQFKRDHAAAVHRKVNTLAGVARKV